jgi:hypothetical protein
MFCPKSSPLTKGGGTPSFDRIFYFRGASTVSTFFCNGPIKITHCKKKVGLMKHPQLININHTKRWISGGWLLGDQSNPPRTIQKRPSTTTSRSWSTRLSYFEYGVFYSKQELWTLEVRHVYKNSNIRIFKCFHTQF